MSDSHPKHDSKSKSGGKRNGLQPWKYGKERTISPIKQGRQVQRKAGNRYLFRSAW